MIYCALEILFAILFFYHGNYFFLLPICLCIGICGKRNSKSIFILSQVILFIFILFRFTYFNVDKIEKSASYFVEEKYNNYVILNNDGNRYLYYSDELEKGNTVTIIAKITLLDDSSEFYSYLKSQRVNYLVEGIIICNDNYISFNKQIINRLLENKDEENKNILKLVLFNQKDDSNERFYSYFEIFSISFMLVISGYHINLLFKLLDKTSFIKYIVVIFYLYLLDFGVSSLKAFLYYVLKKFKNKNDLIINNFDILSIIMIALLFYNPSYCFNKGFIYSFLFSFVIDLLNNTILNKRFRYSFLKKVCIYLTSVPIMLINNYQINTNSFLASIILVYPISFLFIFSFIYLFLDKFYIIYKIYIYLLRLLLDFFNKYSFNLVLGEPNLMIIVALYSLLVLFLYWYENRLYLRSCLCLMGYLFVCVFQYCLPYLDSREMVYFLDVGQGDCSILKIKNSKKVVLIDTGGNKYRDLATDTIIPFLKRKGIDTIDMIVISHDDFDHNGSKGDLINNIKVNKVIEDSLIEEIYIKDNRFINLNVSENRDNDGSIVLYGEYGGIKYLFSGDISTAIEEKIINNNMELEVDILKVSHHGSSSSTSEKFLNHIRAEVGLIGVGKNNGYNHPSSLVIERLNKYNVRYYRTDRDGTITIYKSLISEQIIIEKE